MDDSDVACPTCGDTFDGTRGMKAHHQWHDAPYYDAYVEDELGLSPAEFIKEYHHRRKLTLEETADVIDASATAIVKMADRHDVETRDPSDATELEWEGMDEEERQEQVAAAHEKTRQLVEDGEHNFQDEDFERVLTEEFKDKSSGAEALRQWWDENPDKAQELAEKAAALGPPARDENGMRGVTGQDNPNWRGGKNTLDAVKKQLRPSWWTVRDNARASECYKCGASDCKLDVHHIIPVMSGGTNGEWNLMTLCESCHHEVEWYCRDYDAFDAVLVE